MVHEHIQKQIVIYNSSSPKNVYALFSNLISLNNKEVTHQSEISFRQSISLAEIIETFRKAGFFVMTRKMHKLTDEQVAQLQQAHHGKDYYDELVNYMTR